jgi:hypothetical protein
MNIHTNPITTSPLRRGLVLITLALTGLALAPAARAQGNPSANGGGTTIEGGEKSTFVFNAVEHPDGSVTGHLVYQFRTRDFGFIMDIDCLQISGSGNKAVLSGVVTHLIGEVPPEYWFIFVGAPATFAVMDNGEGHGDPADLFSDVYFGFGDCNEFRPVVYLPMRGNIQVSQ